MGPQIILHAFDPAHLRATHLPKLLEHLVVNQHFSQLNYLDVSVLGFPDLTFGQGQAAFLDTLLRRLYHGSIYLIVGKIPPENLRTTRGDLGHGGDLPNQSKSSQL